MGPQRRGYQQQESYENTDQLRQPGPGQPIYPPLSEPPLRVTSADNPFRCKSSQSFLRSDDQDPVIPTNPMSGSFKSLLVGQGQSEGASADLLKRLEDAISIGDHKLVKIKNDSLLHPAQGVAISICHLSLSLSKEFKLKPISQF